MNEFERDGVKYVAREKEGCDGCAFITDCLGVPNCDRDDRDDSRSIIWVRAELDAGDVVTTASINSALALLDVAAGHMRARAATYDKPEGERSMGKTVLAFNAITGRDLSESEGWLLLQLLKDVRDRQRPAAHRDSLEDCIAYAALKAEARLQETRHA